MLRKKLEKKCRKKLVDKTFKEECLDGCTSRVNKCFICYGYGFWPWGDLCPLGPMDGGELEEVSIQCPWCKSGKKKSGERYKFLLEHKKKNKDLSYEPRMK